MSKRTKPTFTIAIETDAYRIERHHATRDFDCFITGTGYIGTCATQQAAEESIRRYRYDTARRAPAVLIRAMAPKET